MFNEEWCGVHLSYQSKPLCERKFTAFKGRVVQLLNFIRVPEERGSIRSQSRKALKLASI